MWSPANGLPITRAERALFATEGTDAGRVSGCIGAGFIGLLAGVLNSENLLSYSLRKVDKNELVFVEKVVLPTLVNDPYKIVLGCSGIRQYSIDLTKDQGSFIPSIVDAQRKLFRGLLHCSSK